MPMVVPAEAVPEKVEGQEVYWDMCLVVGAVAAYGFKRERRGSWSGGGAGGG